MERPDYHELVANILNQYSDIFVGEGTEVQLITDRKNGHYRELQ